MDFLNQILAKLFDSFKAKNPKIAALVIFLLGVVLYATEHGLSDIVGHDLNSVVQVVSFLLAALQGSRTTYILQETKENKK